MDEGFPPGCPTTLHVAQPYRIPSDSTRRQGPASHPIVTNQVHISHKPVPNHRRASNFQEGGMGGGRGGSTAEPLGK